MQPDETLRGVVPFYTEKFLKEVDTLSHMEDVIMEEETIVVIRDKSKAIEKSFSPSAGYR
jgi:hypothetical protein